jgi:NAD(P)-dependent dehydrogenase (short-subunit alcohol dehydrogenase family)
MRFDLNNKLSVLNSQTEACMTKLALVTGGSRGLGRSSVLALAKAGMDVAFTYHSNQAAADEVVEQVAGLGRKAVALKLDTGDREQRGHFCQTLQLLCEGQWQNAKLDVLVNNAGMGHYASFAETSEAQFDELLNVHFKGVFFLTQKLLPLLNDGAVIINITSGLTRFSFSGYIAYSAMKGAIETFSRCLALELAPRKIRVNTLAPGAIATDFGGGLIRDNSEINQHIASLTALGRVGLPDDIGPLVAALASDNCGWVNGQRIEAAGGIFL